MRDRRPAIAPRDIVASPWADIPGGDDREDRSQRLSPSPLVDRDASQVAAVELAADVVTATTAPAIRKRLLSGLVDDLGMDAAATWAPADRDGLMLHDSVGLPPDVAGAVARLPAGSTPDRMVRQRRAGDDRIMASHVETAWGDRTLYVVAVPEPAPELVGVFARGPASPHVVRLLVALGRTYGAAASRAYALHDSQRVIDAMVGELHPTDIVLPPGYSIGWLYRSATANVPIGGDLFDWFRTNRGDLGVAVGDVSGKGVHAASRTAMAVHSLRAFAVPGASPHVAATMLNAVVSGRPATESFVTLVYVRVDAQSGAVDFVLAGHPPPLVLGHDGIAVVDLPADVPIGVDPAASYTLHHTALRPGETLLLYTDGVTEARSAHDGSLLGVDGLIGLLEHLRGSCAQDIADGIWQGVQRHTGGDTTDDVAVVALQRDVSTSIGP